MALMVMVLCAYALIAPAVAQPTPFMSYGHVYYENGTVCNGSVVNITNLNTGEEWSAEKNPSYNYYQLILANRTHVNKSEILRFSVTCGSQSKKFNHTVTEGELNDGGIFNFNITLVALTQSQQVWYLSSVGKPSGVHSANDSREHNVDNLLHKDIGKKTGRNRSFYLNSTKVAWFYADTGAENGLSFGEGNWTTYIRTEKIDGEEVDHNLTVEICKLDKDTGDITVIADNTTKLNATTDAKHLWIITCEANLSTTQDFSAGDWLAVRLSWDCPTDPLRIYYEIEEHSNSYVKSPSSDPGYPVPELPTLILFSSGLIILAGYVLLKRRE